tara:strand:- start:224 stop:1054 length:831 start_codon:yes stop_codon:yes gene_type:complete
MGRLGIIAARGPLPLQLAQAARGKGEEPYIIRLKGQCDCLFEGFESVCLPVGKLDAVIARLKLAECDKLALVGQFKRPAFADISLDKSGVALMGRLILTGDDAALRVVVAYFYEHNIAVVSNAEYLPQQVLPLLYRTQRPFTAGEGDAAKHARTVLDSLGNLDIGQSVVVQQRRVLAIEGAEGTNEMIARTLGLIDKSQPDTVFVKMSKTGQDIALDMPVFGLETLSNLEKSGIRAVCLEGEKIMLADPLDVISAAADKAGISICTFASLSEEADD